MHTNVKAWRVVLVILVAFGTTSFYHFYDNANIGSRPNDLTTSLQEIQSLTLLSSESGKVSLAVDAAGSTGSTGYLFLEKHAGATVRKAYLAAASTGFSNYILTNGDIYLAGNSITWDQVIPNSINSYNAISDVTSIVKPILDNYGPASIRLEVWERVTEDIEGEILAVIFDDPNLEVDNSVGLMFGSQNVYGDSFSINLTTPITKADPNLVLDLSLGISYGCQGASYCGGGPSAQYSQINVNGTRLTTSAGGWDDGELNNGALITAGGIGDSRANPSNPGAYPVTTRDDDELYNLLPFVNDGDRTIRVDTWNPSIDDNIFFAGFFLGGSEGDFIVPFLDLPVAYNYTQFSIAAMGSNNGVGPGRVNSWFDHEVPTYYKDGYIKPWNGERLSDPEAIQCVYGSNCYDGHNGIDFIKRTNLWSEPATAAASGIVRGVTNEQENIVCPMGAGYGNCVLIEHIGTRFATLYGHLDTIAAGIELNAPVVEHQVLGSIGNTGRSTGPHLHFGVYYDKNRDNRWSESEVVDPYGWSSSNEDDPWSMNSVYLWKFPLVAQCLLTAEGSMLTSQSGTVTAIFPQDATDTPLNIELWNTIAPESASSAQLRSIGQTFRLNVLEWFSQPNKQTTDNENNGFNIPITLDIQYADYSLAHLDENGLTLVYWDDITQTWSPVSTTVDIEQDQVLAETLEAGTFDLQAPLLCNADQYEINDRYESSHRLSFNHSPMLNLFDIETDEDWFRFEAVQGGKYSFWTDDLAEGVDTILQILDTNLSVIESDSASSVPGSAITWIAPKTNIYYLKITPTADSDTGCSASYNLFADQLLKLFLPLNLRY